jgi:transposase InsO family protein
MVHLVPINTTTKASELASLYVKEVVHLHRLPDSFVSDRDSKFTSMFWRETHQILGTKLLMSTSFHPQTDGASERVNRSVGQILRMLILPNQLIG